MAESIRCTLGQIPVQIPTLKPPRSIDFDLGAANSRRFGNATFKAWATVTFPRDTPFGESNRGFSDRAPSRSDLTITTFAQRCQAEGSASTQAPGGKALMRLSPEGREARPAGTATPLHAADVTAQGDPQSALNRGNLRAVDPCVREAALESLVVPGATLSAHEIVTSPLAPLTFEVPAPVQFGAHEGPMVPPAEPQGVADRADGPLTTAEIENLWRFGDSRAVPYLLEFIARNQRDSRLAESVTQATVSVSMLLIEYPEHQSRVATCLLALCRDPATPPAVAATALETLMSGGNPEALELGRLLCADRSAHPKLRCVAACTDPSAHQATLAELTREPSLDPEDQARMLVSLASVDPGADERLTAALLDSDPAQDSFRTLLLQECSIQQYPARATVLAKLCADGGSPLAIQAAELLCSQGEAADIRRALHATPASSPTGLMLIDALAMHGTPDDSLIMVRSLAHDPSPAALRYFAAGGMPIWTSREILIEAVRSMPPHGAESETLLLLARSGRVEDRTNLVAQSHLLSSEEQMLAIAILAESGDIANLRDLRLGTTDAAVLLRVDATLAMLGDTAATERLLSQRDDRQVRQEVFEALALSSAPDALSAVVSALGEVKSAHRQTILLTLQTPDLRDDFIARLRNSADLNHQAYAETLVRAVALDIHSPFRYTPRALEHIIAARTSAAPPAPGVRQALLVAAAADYNGALSASAGAVEALIDRGFRVVLFETSSDTGVLEALQSHARYGQSDVIIFEAHGNPDAIEFGESDAAAGRDAQLDLSDRERLLKPGVGSALKEGGRVILNSCGTGAGGVNAPNLVNLMREVFPHAAPGGITGPTTPSISSGLEFDETGMPVKPEGWEEYLFVRSLGRVSGVALRDRTTTT